MAVGPISFLLSPAILAGIPLLYCFVIAFYRIHLHPLKNFPGPKLAAVTKLYRAWFQIVQDGGQLKQWNILHEQYGKFRALNKVCLEPILISFQVIS